MCRNHCGWWCDLLRVKVAGTVLFWPGHACPCKPHGGTALSPFSRRMNTLHQNTIWMDKASPVQTVQHSEQTLKTALISKNPVLVSQSEKWEAGERVWWTVFQPYIGLFGLITLHLRSNWITSYPEAPQDFEQFFSDP